MTKVWISQDDSFILSPNDEEEIKQQFGEYFLEWNTSYVEIPEELYIEFLKVSVKFWEVQEKLRPFYEKQYEEKLS